MEHFNNRYQVSKTLKFELDPIKETREKLAEFSKYFSDVNSLDSEEFKDNIFKKDKDIKKAKKILQEVLNSIHEQIITTCLSSAETMQIDFMPYYNAKLEGNTNIENIEKSLREQLKDCFVNQLRLFNSQISSVKKKKQKDGGIKKDKKSKNELADLVKGLGEDDLLIFISAKADKYTTQTLKKEDIEDACKTFKGYWGLMDKFIENRKNYYVFDVEQDTAIATRIVSDILPTFCINAIQYQKEKETYDSIYSYLKSLNITMEIKNPMTGEMEPIDTFDTTIFNPHQFSKYLTQECIEEYNKTISKNATLINLYNQQKGEGKKLKPFVTLHKQIGCKETNSAKRIEIKHDWEKSAKGTQNENWSLEALLKKIIALADIMIVPEEANPTIPCIANLINWLENVKSWSGIYVNDKSLNKISSKYLEDWFSLQDLLKQEKSVGSYNPNKELNERFKLNQAVELSPVFNALDKKEFDSIFKTSIYKDYCKTLDKSLTPSRNIMNMLCYDVKQKIMEYSELKEKVKEILNTQAPHKEGFFQQEDNIDIIREYLDCILDVFRFVRTFSVRLNKIKGAPYNMELLQLVSSLLDKNVADWSGWYDEIRNYLCRLPQDEVKNNKLKLNFESSSLLKGWSVGEEQGKLSMIIKKDETYYLCILKKDAKSKKIFDMDTNQDSIYTNNGTAYRMTLRNLAFRTLVGKGYVSKFHISYSKETNEEQAVGRAQQLIRENYLKDYPNLANVICKSYDSKSSFQKDVIDVLSDYAQCSYVPIKWDVLLQLAAKCEVYVFKIHSKDYRPHTSGKKDLQTIYFEDVLSGNSLHQLSANGEIFRREALSKEKKNVVHEKGSILVNKRYKDGKAIKTIPDDIYKIVHAILNNNPLPEIKGDEEKNRILKKNIEKARKLVEDGMIVKKIARFDITKDARFYEDKYFLHNPIKLNYKAKAYDNKAISYGIAYLNENSKIQELMHREGKVQNFIGIDRGEKNLIYACKIDSNGEIQSCEPYNIVNGINYLEKIEERAEERKEAKQSWKQQESIKNLKNGYISHVIHHLLNDAIPYGLSNTIPSYIVLEKLSREMKRGRQKFEKQIYQKFELALAQKLSLYVNKEAEEGQPGSIQMPLQFVPPVNTFDQIDKKDSFGIMLYTRANYTSITDPLTGWRKTIYIANGNNEEIKKQLTTKFKNFEFDGEDYVFTYVEGNVGQEWKLYSGFHGKSLDRFEYNKNTKTYERYDIVEKLNALFEKFDKSQSLLEQMKQGVELKKVDENRTAYESLRKAINMIQQIRNTGSNKGDDNFLLSPVRNSDGTGIHFDTRKSEDFGNLSHIKDADANGAFNIARKGLIMDAHYKYWVAQGKPTIKKEGKKGKESSALSLYISDREWDMWLLKRDMWENNLCEFALRSQD